MVALLFTFVGCKKSLQTENLDGQTKSMNELEIPGNFQWEMSTGYTFLIRWIYQQHLDRLIHYRHR